MSAPSCEHATHLCCIADDAGTKAIAAAIAKKDEKSLRRLVYGTYAERQDSRDTPERPSLKGYFSEASEVTRK
jgi:hypothetical protein